jgi:hypothetical protein
MALTRASKQIPLSIIHSTTIYIYYTTVIDNTKVTYKT